MEKQKEEQRQKLEDFDDEMLEKLGENEV